MESESLVFNPVLRFGSHQINALANTIYIDDRTLVFLTPSETRLLVELVKNSDCVVTRSELKKATHFNVAQERIIDTHISYLRKKLPKAFADKIKSVPCEGYRFESNDTK